MADYETKAHNVDFSFSFIPTAKVKLFGRVNYSMSEAASEQVVMSDAELLLEGELHDQDFTFENMHTYNDLDYDMLQIDAGVKYKLQPNLALTVDGTYADLTDNAGYIFGIESGSYFMVRSGLMFTF